MNIDIRPHDTQKPVLRSLFVEKNKRNATVCCSRGWGKSYVGGTAAMMAIAELVKLPKDVPHKNVYIIAPTFDQVIDIYFPLLMYEMGVEGLCVDSTESRGRIYFPRNTQLRLISYETIQRMRGKGSYFTVWDEVSSCTNKIHPMVAWESVIEPCMKTRWSPENARKYGAPSPGRGLLLSTPCGYDHFKDFFDRGFDGQTSWASFQYDYTQSPFLDPDEIKAAAHDMDPVRFASEYLAQFKESGNSVFYCFDRELHVSSDLPFFSENEVIHVPIDFNVDKMCASLCAIRNKEVHVLDELMGHPDTETLAAVLKNRFPKHKLVAYPDPTGRSRKSSASVGRTDFTILESYGIHCLARDSSPNIVDSVAAVNRKLKTYAGDVSFYIHPRCKRGIVSLERTRWAKGGDNAVIDKSDDIEHFSDGFRYFVEYEFPIRNHSRVSVKGFNF